MTFKSAFWILKKEIKNLTKSQIYVLFEHLTNQNLDWILDNWESEIPNPGIFNQIFLKLKQGYPFAYVINEKTFFGHRFYVDESVLIPRDETEILVQEANNWLKQYPQSAVLDLCTGSGAIGLSLKLTNPEINLTISDISIPALETAQNNAKRLNLKINSLQGDFLIPSIEKKKEYNLVVCNPPYVNEKSPEIGLSTKFEPVQALFPPTGVLQFYQTFFNDGAKVINFKKPFAIFFEFGFDQKNEIEKLIKQTLWLATSKVEFFKDWAGYWRFVKISRGIK